MQTARTQRGNRVISLLVFLILIGYAHPVPLQFLPNIPGYIPVYIRHGDEPLEGINPDLAEAFGETSKSVKSLQLAPTLDNVSDRFKDDDIDALLGESKSKRPSILQVRQTGRQSFAKNDESEIREEPKLLSIYQLPHANDRRNRRRHRGGGTRRKTAKQHVFKVSPISDTEKEELEKMAIEIEKEETKPNELYTSASKLPSEKSHDRHKVDNFVLKIREPLDESSRDLPEIRQTTDFSKPLDSHSVEVKKEEQVIKKQHPSTILSNVQKVSPIVSSNKSGESNDN